MREVEARLKISAIDRTGRVLSNVGNKLDAVNRKTTMLNRAQSAMMSQMAYFARYAVPAAVAYEMVQATEKAADFQESLFKIQKKSGATADQMSALGGEIKALFTEMPVKSIEEMATAFERGAAAGIPLDDLKEFAKTTLMIADGWDTTAEDTANFMAGFNKGLGIPIDKMEAFASLINDLADSGIADEKDIADFLDRVGASLKNFGLTPEQIAGYGAAMLNLKIPSEVAARAMDTLSGKLLAPENLAPKSRTALTKIVGDLKQFSKLSGNEKLTRFMKSLQGMTNQRKASLLGALLGEGFDDEIMRVVSAYDEVERNQGMVAKHMANASHSVSTLYEKQQDLFNKQWQVLKNNISDLEISFGERLLPLATKFVALMNEGFKGQREFADGAKVISGGDRELFVNTRQEWVKRYKALGFTNEDGTRGVKAEWEDAVKRRGLGSKNGGVDNEFGWLSLLDRRRYGRQYSGGPSRRFTNSRRTGNLPANWLGANPASGNIPRPLTQYEKSMQDYYGQGGDIRSSVAPAVKNNKIASISNPYGDEIAAARKAQEEATAKFMALGKTSDDAGQSIKQGGEDGGKALENAAAAAGAILIDAANTLAAKLSGVKIQTGQSPVNANVGRTDTFVRSPNTGHQ